MGKRKRATKKPAPLKKMVKLSTVFVCPYCGHKQIVDCIINRESSIGEVKCRICSVQHKISICKIEEEVDVHANWIGAIVDMQLKANAAAGRSSSDDLA